MPTVTTAPARMQRILGLMCAMIALTGALFTATAQRAHAAPADAGWVEGLYKTPYSSTIYYYSPDCRCQYGIDYDTWSSGTWTFPAQPFQAPTIIDPAVVKYAWSPTLYAVTFFPGDWQWDRLTLQDWAALKYKAPYNAGWIEGSYITRYGSSPELFLTGEDGSLHKLTFPQWAATGYVRPEPWDLDTGFVRYRNSATIYEVGNYGTNNEFRFPITYSEWRDLQFPTPAVR